MTGWGLLLSTPKGVVSPRRAIPRPQAAGWRRGETTPEGVDNNNSQPVMFDPDYNMTT